MFSFSLVLQLDTQYISFSCCCRFIIYKLPRYKIEEVGSGVDYMYLDSSVGTWQKSQFMVNTSQGAIGNTLNPLYTGKVYKVRLCFCSTRVWEETLVTLTELYVGAGLLSRRFFSNEELGCSWKLEVVVNNIPLVMPCICFIILLYESIKT